LKRRRSVHSTTGRRVPGFEHFFGFIGGEVNQYFPPLFEGTTPIEPDKTPDEGYHLMEDLADKAIAWMRGQKAIAPDKPFFIYFAPGATHAPHHVPKDWIAKYKGKFDQGWDKVREETFARQKKLGVIPLDCELTARPKEIPRGKTPTRDFARCLHVRWRSMRHSLSTPIITQGV
jgi:arylsulfatase